MGILARSTRLTQFQVTGEHVQPEDIGFLLAARRFISIDATADPLSAGWVTLDDYASTDFSDGVIRGRFAAFSLRVDRRKVPAAVLKQHVGKAEAEWLAAHPGLQRVPKAKREELRDMVLAALLAKTLPTPAVCDCVWDVPAGILTLTTHNRQAIDLFTALFRAAFVGVRLVPFHPYARALSVADGPLREPLEAMNGAAGDGVLELIRDNRWLGQDFLLWLTYMSANGNSEFGDIVCYVEEKMTLVGATDGGKQKITAAGPMNHFAEIMTALREGKWLTKGTIRFERGEESYSLNLDAETFRFGSLKTPPVRLEKDDMTDAASEREAVFYEKMHLLQTAGSFFDTILRAFLERRLSATWWKQTSDDIQRWLGEG